MFNKLFSSETLLLARLYVRRSVIIFQKVGKFHSRCSYIVELLFLQAYLYAALCIILSVHLHVYVRKVWQYYIISYGIIIFVCSVLMLILYSCRLWVLYPHQINGSKLLCASFCPSIRRPSVCSATRRFGFVLSKASFRWFWFLTFLCEKRVL